MNSPHHWYRAFMLGPHGIIPTPRQPIGYIVVGDEGVEFCPEDDAYAGSMSKEEALALAREIVARYGS